MGEIIIATVATFGVAGLIAEYDGPADVLLKLREKVTLTRCIVCMSVWIAPVMLALLAYDQYWIVYSAAVVGVIILIERMV